MSDFRAKLILNSHQKAKTLKKTKITVLKKVREVPGADLKFYNNQDSVVLVSIKKQNNRRVQKYSHLWPIDTWQFCGAGKAFLANGVGTIQ